MTLNPKNWAKVITLGSGLLLGGCATTTVFRGGQVLLPVLVATDAPPAERAAAKELARVLEKMSGLSWPVRSAVDPAERGIYVGRQRAGFGPRAPLKPATNLLAPKPGEVGPDGFRIATQGGSVFLEGATPEATGFAVAWLLQQQGGVRWYAPGATGEIIPRRRRWQLPELHLVREPAYVSRELTGLPTPAEEAWARHNGLRRRLEFSHALPQVFPSAVTEAHPDWWPLLGDNPYRPAASGDNNWQPNLALPAVAEHAARTAAAAFAHDPGRASFSLGLNDTVRFDQGPATRSLVEPLRYFRGRPDYSPLVFAFMNRTAESLARTHPDRYLGCLAYFWCENPPPFRVHPQVLPYVTADRSQYFDPAFRQGDLDLLSRWGASGVKAFGLWEYAYGYGFLVPRMPIAALAESVRAGWQRGARGYLAEVNPHWGFDAFKVWMLAQLLWEPDRSLDELAADFYSGYYGRAAAPMRRFFEQCETQWMTQAGPPFWLKFYLQEDQAGLFPPEVGRELRRLLTAAARAVRDDPASAARVELTSKAFAVTEAYLEFDQQRRRLAGMEPAGTVVSEAAVSDAIADLVRAKAGLVRNGAAATEGELPAMTAVDLPAYWRNDPVPRLLGLAGRLDPEAPRRILARAGALDYEPWRAFADLLAGGHLEAATSLVANGDFRDSAGAPQRPRFLYPHSGVLPAKWEWRAMPTENGRAGLVGLDAASGARALHLEGAWDTQFYQWIPVEPDCVYVATAQLRGNSSPGNDSALFLTFLDPAGKVVGQFHMQSLPKGLTSDWRLSVLAEQAPPQAAWVGVGIGASRQSAGDWLEAATVELRGVILEGKP